MAAAALVAQSPAVNYQANLGNPGASAAAFDSAGNLYVIAISTLIKLGPDGSILATSTPAPGKLLMSVTVDSQDRVIVGGSGFVARPPDFLTSVSGPVVQVAADRDGNIWAISGGLQASTTRYGEDIGASALTRLTPEGKVAWTKKLGGASIDNLADLAIDAAGSIYVALTTNSAELPSSGFEPLLNGIPGAVSYDGGGYFYPVYGIAAAINQWLLTDANTVYIATQGQGVARSTDRGQSFESRSQGLPDTTVNMIAVDPANAQTLYAATKQGLAKTSNGGTNWSPMTLPSGSATVLAVAVHPKNRAHLYASVISSTTGCAFYRSIDGGVTWQPQQTSSGFPLCLTGFLTDPNDAAGVYAYGLGNGFALPATGATWIQVSTFMGLVVAADPATFSTWYALADGGIYKSTNKGATWTLVQPGFFTALAVGRPYIVAGTNSGSISISRDSGATWTPATTPPFAQPVRSLLSDSGTIFAGATYNPGIWLGKYSPDDGQLLQSTFLGGTGSETAARLAVDPQGVVTVAMESDSTDAPTTLDATQRRSGGGTDIVITRLTPSFTLQYASYFGGSGDERIGAINLDSQGFLYMAGSTQSPNLPLSANALQPVLNGSSDAFATVFNPSANGIVYSSYFGGPDDDRGVALLPDPKGNAVLIGHSTTDSFALSVGGLIGYQPIAGAIRNAASLAAGPLAPGSLATIDGSYGAISGISVLFNGLPATVVQSRDNSMDVALPDGLQPGAATVTIQSRNGLTQGTVPVAAVAPGIFSANHDGKGVVLATLVRVYADGTQENEAVFQCADACVALPIDFGDDTDTLFLQITATGLRNQTDLSHFQVAVGGQPATVISVGSQGISPGLDQITIQLPRPADGFVGPAQWDIQLTVDGQTANTVSILVG